MTVQGIISLLKRTNPDWTDQQLIDLLNMFCEMCLKGDQTENLYFDPSTGQLPILSTTQGTYLYTLSSTYYKCRYILVKEDSWDDRYDYPNNPSFAGSTSRYIFDTAPVIIGTYRYRQVPVILTPSYGSNPATALFQFNPQTTTNKYFIYAYVGTTAITVLTSTIPIEERFHLAVVVPAMQMLIDGLDHGDFANIMPVVETQFVSKILLQKYYNSHPDTGSEAQII